MSKASKEYLLKILTVMKDHDLRKDFLRALESDIQRMIQEKIKKVRQKKEVSEQNKQVRERNRAVRDVSMSDDKTSRRQTLYNIRKGLIPVGVAMAALMMVHNGDKEMFAGLIKAGERYNKEELKEINVGADYGNESKFVIREDGKYEELFDRSMDNVFRCLLCTEAFRPNPHDDGNGYVCSIGLGSFYYPINGDPTCPVWVKASEYFKKDPSVEVSLEEAKQLVVGWGKYFNNGSVYNRLYDNLQGVRLTEKQFAAIYCVTYNNVENGVNLCQFIKEHQNDPVAVANFIVNLPCKKKFENGILRRHTLEALMYLYPDLDLHYRKMDNRVVTPMDCLSLKVCKKIKAELARGDTKTAERVSDWLSHWLCRSEDKINIEDAHKSTYFLFNMIKMTGEVLYANAQALCEKGQYNEAAKCYDLLFKKGYHGMDLYVDAAICYGMCGNAKRYGDCLVLYKKAVKESGKQDRDNMAELHFVGGVASMHHTGDRETAKVRFKKSYVLNPKLYRRMLDKMKDDA